MDDVPEITEPHPAPVRKVLIRAPLVPLALALAVGVFAGRYGPLPLGVWFAVALAGLVVAVVTLRRAHLHLLTGMAVGAVVLGIGAGRFQTVYFSVPREHIVTYTGATNMLATIRGRVVSYPQIFRPNVEFGYRPEPRIVFLLDSEAVRTTAGWEKTSGLVRVSIDEPYKTFRPGERLELTGWMGRFRPPDNPGQYDAAAAAHRSGTWVRFTSPTADNVKIIAPAEGGWAGRGLWRVRATLRQHLLETGDLRSGRLLSALILGDRDPALATLNRTMKQAGISHFLSISGLHLGVFLGFVYLICRVFMLAPRRSAAVVLVVLVCYLLLAEARPPLLRSAIMAAALLVGVIWSRPNSSLNALGAAAIVLLLIDPRQLFSPGVQLSFVTVAGLILWYRPVRSLLFWRWIQRRGLMVFRHEQRVRRWVYFTLANGVMDIITMSTTAYLVSAPLVAMYFGIFSPWAIILNVLLFPLIVAVLIPGYLSMALALPAPNLSSAVGALAAGAADLLANCVQALRVIPFLSISLRPMGVGWAMLCFATFLAAVLVRRNRHRRVLVVILAAALVIVTVWSQHTSRTDGEAQLDLLAVGAGQCAVLQTPSGKTFLIDAGTRSGFDVYNRVLSPFLRTMRLPDPTAVIVSHANTDHYNALPGVVRSGRVHQVYLCDYFDRGRKDTYSAPARIMKILQEHGVEVSRLRRGSRVNLDTRTQVEVLWPPSGREDLTFNDTSLVLRISCGGKTVLLPGDIDQPAQGELLKDPQQLRSDVLVLPHHGGWEKTLPDFVAAVDPKIILVSGRADPKGPSASGERTRKFYWKLKSDYRYYSTARNGWIRLTFGAGGLDVQTMR